MPQNSGQIGGHPQRALSVDPAELLEQATMVERHQLSWQYLLAGQQPVIAGSAFGAGLAVQGQRGAEVLQGFHTVREQQTSGIQNAARAARDFAREADSADSDVGQSLGRLLE